MYPLLVLCRVSLELIPASSEIESLEFNGTDNSSLEINITTYSIVSIHQLYDTICADVHTRLLVVWAVKKIIMIYSVMSFTAGIQPMVTLPQAT